MDRVNVIATRKIQSPREELVNSITHGFGLLLSIIGSAMLVVPAVVHGDIKRIICFSIYGSSLITMYAVSTLCHGFSLGRTKNIFTLIDYSAIYLLIAGTYTPLALISLGGAWGWSFFGTIWAMAFAGIALTLILGERAQVLSIVIYLLMGWLGVVAIPPIVKNIPFSAIVLLVAGGILYSLGVIFYFREKLPLHHAIFHIFVLGGSLCHYLAILFYV
jgi:hemolysin III